MQQFSRLFFFFIFFVNHISCSTLFMKKPCNKDCHYYNPAAYKQFLESKYPELRSKLAISQPCIKIGNIANLTQDLDLMIVDQDKPHNVLTSKFLSPSFTSEVNYSQHKKAMVLRASFYEKYEDASTATDDSILIAITSRSGGWCNTGVIDVSINGSSLHTSLSRDLGKCVACNSNKIDNFACANCQKSCQKFSNRKTIDIDLNFVQKEKDEELRVFYKIR